MPLIGALLALVSSLRVVNISMVAGLQTAFLSSKIVTVVPLLRDHPVVNTMEVFEEGWSFIRGRK